jgi:hypothetical protein
MSEEVKNSQRSFLRTIKSKFLTLVGIDGLKMSFLLESFQSCYKNSQLHGFHSFFLSLFESIVVVQRAIKRK